MVEPILEVEGISKTFGSFTAIREVSFEARPGEVIGLLGPNGAGKTTTIRVLTTIFKPSSGKFTVDGKPHTQSQTIRTVIGVLPENSDYPPHWTGVEFLAYHARLYGYSGHRARERAMLLLEEVGLSERATSPIGIYSRGMRQRLGVARALVNQPRLIFLDEPTLGLDPAGQRQMLQLIRQVASQRAAAVILSTHLLDEVEDEASRVIILNRGNVIADGTVADIKRKVAPRRVSIRFPAAFRNQAMAILEEQDGITRLTAEEEGHGTEGFVLLSLTLDETGRGRVSEEVTNTWLRLLIDAHIPITSFEKEGGRLSDAFFALTEESNHGNTE